MKTDKKIEAIALREQGNSMRNIAIVLGVAKSSVSLWVRHIEVDAKAKERVIAIKRTLGSYQGSARIIGDRARAKRLMAQERGAGQFLKLKVPLFGVGCMLYWCEGHKSKNVMDFSNSDPDVIKVFMQFLRGCLFVVNDKIRLRIYAYLNNGITQRQIEDYWLTLTGLDRSNMHKGTYDKHSKLSSRRKRNLLYGTVHISVCDTEKLHMIYGGIASICGEPHKFLF